LNGRKLLEKITENWFAKVASIFVAIVLFVFHRVSALEERFLSVPLTVRSENSLIPANSYPRIVRVSLRGESSSIFLIVDSDIEVYVDLSSYTEPGSYQVPIEINKTGTALGVEPLEIQVDPVEVSFELDYRERRVVPVTPSFTGAPEDGYELASYTIEPSQVEIVGPRRRIEEIASFSTDYIELKDRNSNFTSQVHILNNDPLVVIQGGGAVEIRGLIRGTIIQRNFDNIPIQFRDLNSRFSSDDLEWYGRITLEGSQNPLQSLVLPAGVLYVDCSGINLPGSYTLPVHAEAPGSFETIAFEPGSVDVEIQTGP
jgi:YbbR domain-containing protein